MKEKSIIKNFLSYGLGGIITLIIGFITSPIVTRLINPVEFGKFSMFTMFTTAASIIIICGLDQSFVRFFYEEEEYNRPKLLLFSLKIPLIVIIILSIIMILIYKQISLLLFESTSLEIVMLLIINNIILVVNRFATLVIRMQQKGKIYSYTQIWQKISYIIFVLILFVPFNKSVNTLVYATTFSNIIITVYAILVEKNFWKMINSKKLIVKSKENEFVKYGFPLVFTTLITWIFQSTDRIVIQRYSGFEELGIYGSAFTIISLLNTMQNTFTTFWIPVAYEKYENEASNKEFFISVNRIISLSMFYICILLILFKDVIVYLLGSKYRQAGLIMPFLIFMPLMYTISETTVLGINFKKKPKYHILIATVSCLTNIIGNILLVPKIGAKGAAIATGVSYIIFFTMRTIISQKLYDIDYGLIKFYLCTFFISVFALYSSFYKFNYIILIMGVLNLSIITIVYFDIIKFCFYKIVKLKMAKYK